MGWTGRSNERSQYLESARLRMPVRLMRRAHRSHRCRVAAVDEHGSEAAVKAAGQLRAEGKEYVVADGDILHFL